MAPTAPDTASTLAASSRSTDAPRRCFICLTDQEPSDPPSSWVDPCPCTLEAHQDCMLSWVTDCERSNKPLLCPVCKYPIALEGPWDPIVAVTGLIANKFTRASPYVLLTSMAMGVQFSMQMYGAFAMWAFSGRDSLIHFMLGPEPGVGGQNSRVVRMAGERLGNALILMNVGPALLVGQLTPWLANKIFLPVASLYGVYHVMHDEQFLSWPPSPQLAIAIFPYLHTAYFNVWREFAYPFEVSLNRKLMGLPPLENRPAEEQGAANDRPAAPRNDNNEQGGGVVGFLNNLINALEPDVEDEDGNPIANNEERWNDGLRDGPAPEGQREAENANGGEHEPEQQQQQQQQEHEAPQAPPARRPGLGTILSGVSNAIVSALILPGISYAMGELLRLALPKSWTTASRNPWFRPGGILRPGLLQQQWGRSLVGGCLWVVMKDMVRLYTKYRKVSAMGQRTVKNVERSRRAK
ncbi:hypothetical protein BGZ63DRAFT_175622 [Mariannaea sp. PMI_226]|nr:hypothetical protein BGZ63DRAFT_175622 [Mariannaea sp. PMI_226]